MTSVAQMLVLGAAEFITQDLMLPWAVDIEYP